MNPLDLLGSAAHRKLRAQEALALANADLAAALRGMHQGGMPKCHVALEARMELRSHGFDDDMLRRLALSNASVRLVLDRKE